MKKHLRNTSLFLLAAVSLIAACDDYDIERTANDDGMQEKKETVISYPDIKPEWDLQLVTNIGNQSDSVFVYKDLKYNAMFTRTRGWNGGDGAYSTLLPDGNVFWSFGMSYFGIVDAESRARIDGNQPLNGLMIQKATNGVLGETSADCVWLADYVNYTDSTAEKYFWGRTHLRHPLANKTDKQIENGEIDTGWRFRPLDATAVGDKLQMIWCETSASGTSAVGSAFAIYDLNGDMPVGFYQPGLSDYLPQKGNYMYRSFLNDEYTIDSPVYGFCILEDEDGHSYLYGLNGNDVLVARTQTHDLNSAWEYYIRNAQTGTFEWQSTFPTTEETQRSFIMDNGYQCAQPWVFKDGEYYYMVAQGTAYSPNIYIYRSQTPYGPFTDQQLLFVLPAKLDKLKLQTYKHVYNVNLHQELSRVGELVLSTNTDADDEADNYTFEGSADFQRPYFYRVFNWKRVFDKEQ